MLQTSLGLAGVGTGRVTLALTALLCKFVWYVGYWCRKSGREWNRGSLRFCSSLGLSLAL